MVQVVLVLSLFRTLLRLPLQVGGREPFGKLSPKPPPRMPLLAVRPLDVRPLEVSVPPDVGGRDPPGTAAVRPPEVGGRPPEVGGRELGGSTI